MRRCLALLLIVGVVASCARHKPNSGDLQEMDAILHVENHHWGDVDIYVIHDGTRSRVGTVTATSDETFTLSPRVIGTVGTLQLLAHGVGLPGVLSSETFAIRRGMQIEWTLESNLSRGNLAIY